MDANFRLKKNLILDVQEGFVDNYNSVVETLNNIQGSGNIEVEHNGNSIIIRDKTEEPDPNKAGSDGDDDHSGEDGNNNDSDSEGNAEVTTKEIWVVTDVQFDTQQGVFKQTKKKVKVVVEDESEEQEEQTTNVFSTVKYDITENIQ